jgi:hypothetical protein
LVCLQFLRQAAEFLAHIFCHFLLHCGADASLPYGDMVMYVHILHLQTHTCTSSAICFCIAGQMRPCQTETRLCMCTLCMYTHTYVQPVSSPFGYSCHMIAVHYLMPRKTAAVTETTSTYSTPAFPVQCACPVNIQMTTYNYTIMNSQVLMHEGCSGEWKWFAIYLHTFTNLPPLSPSHVWHNSTMLVQPFKSFQRREF